MGSNLTFAPGETDISEVRFSPTVVLFWIKFDMAVTNQRVFAKQRNTLFGIIPLGYADSGFPLKNVASAGVEVKFSLGRLIVGAILALVGIGLFGKSVPLAVVLLLIGITMLANTLSAALLLVNNGGGRNYVRVSVFEKRKLEQFRDHINQRLYRDNDGLRHNDVMGAHQFTAQLQEQQLRTLQGMHGGQQPLQAQPQQPQQPQRQYQVGDVVNGHRFNGVAWVPLQGGPTDPPRPY